MQAAQNGWCDFHGVLRGKTLTLPAGRSLMRGATNAGVEAIVAECGGTLTCATCDVIVDPAWAERLPAPPASLALPLGHGGQR